MSLVVPYDLTAMRPNRGRRGTLVRFSLGLEGVDDLIADASRRSRRSPERSAPPRTNALRGATILCRWEIGCEPANSVGPR